MHARKRRVGAPLRGSRGAAQEGLWDDLDDADQTRPCSGLKLDEQGQVVAPPDPKAQEEMNELGDRLVEFRNKFLHDA